MNNTQITLKRYPVGQAEIRDFATAESRIPSLKPGEVLVEMKYLGLEPSARPRMSPVSNYSTPITIGDVIFSTGVGKVVDSRSSEFSLGDWVFALSGWQTHFKATAEDLRAIDIEKAPPAKWLSLLGLSAFTGYTGINTIAKPALGQTVLVSAAAGATGAIAGQVAKIHGAKVCGIAGGDEKCRYVKNVLGFDECIDYRQGSLVHQLQKACPEGIDVNFENVGGAILDAVLPNMNQYGRVILCGLVAQYNSLDSPQGANLWPVVYKSLRIQGFLASRYWHLIPEFVEQMLLWERQGKITHTEALYQGLESCPVAFADLLSGGHLGKVVVEI